MTMEKKKEFLVNAAFYGVLFAAAGLFVAYLLGPLCPFIFGFLIAWLLQKPAKAMSRAFHLPGRLSAFLLTVVFYGVLFIAVGSAGLQAVSALEHFLPGVPTLYTTVIVPMISEAFDALKAQLLQFDPAVVELVDRIGRDMVSSMNDLISTGSVTALRVASGVVAAMPSAILTVVITVIATGFITMDFDAIVGFIQGRLPARFRTFLSTTVAAGMASLRRILLAYLFIMFISFCELSIGFLLLRVPYAIGLALLVSVVDILPILGTGTVLIPWALIAAVLGHFRMAAGVALLYVFMMLVRNVMEPKLVGQQIGLHPAATLLCMFVGLKLFGFAGMFGVPLTVVLCLKLRAISRRAHPA